MKHSPYYYVWERISSILDEKVLDEIYFNLDDTVDTNIRKEIRDLFPSFFSTQDINLICPVIMEKINVCFR